MTNAQKDFFSFDEVLCILGYFGCGGVWGWAGTQDFISACGDHDYYERRVVEAYLGYAVPNYAYK